ncbi:MAG: hydrogenase 2 operon protein HybA [Candidatus Accumulibacter sp.]|uniref:hydrogenase 2 operon protein HybA n=1 Tax=Accumulibacter sp. TaxID=2053492 RepID=UPI0025ECC0DC|nr:hydrogenase 2 operon protein HybA [Accumulibacter sp.]MCM8597122.1 hydrogenase 2 operon protein HybA [Accumulibacter sp.]MCM8664281.1 hydrogenase 2 operon protein HybA [Accumulibacter sp.]
MGMDRRNFLKAASGGTLAASCVPSVQARETRTMPEGAVGLLYDGTLCIGCRACMAACKAENDLPPEFNEIEGSAYWDAPLDLSGRTINIIKAYVGGDSDRKDTLDGYAFTKLSCFHCVDASCVSCCPVAAMTKDPVTGIVSHSKEACIGCRYCVAACPFGVPRFTYDETFPHIAKCQLCRHRMAQGKFAACAEVCPTGATIYGPVKELKKEIARRRALAPGTETEFPRGHIGSGDTHIAPIANYVDHVWGEKEIGGTQVLHLSAVPFDRLDKKPLPDVAPANVSESLQGRIYHGMIAPLAFLGALVFAAKRSAKALGEQGEAGGTDAGDDRKGE